MKPDSMEGLPIPSMFKGLMGSDSSTGAPQAPVFGAAASKPKAKSQVASFLNSDALPASGNTGTKTLTGQ